MTQAQQLEARIRSNRMLTLPVTWTDEIIFPYYQGLSLRNVPHTAAAALGVPLPDSAPLLDDVWQGQYPAHAIDRVVIFLLDGMGYKHLQLVMEQDADVRQAVEELTGGRGAVPLTSVAPSTTAVALTTLWTGAAPGQTGLVGTTMLIREFSTLGNMLAFQPMRGKHFSDIFADWGLPPESIVGVQGISEHLAQNGIESYTVLDRYLSGSGLSRILHRGIEHKMLHTGNSDLMLRLEDTLRQTRGKRGYIGAYWGALDSIAHAYGAHNRYTHNELRAVVLALRDLVHDPDLRDGRTLFILMADHGHYDAPDSINLQKDNDAAPLRRAMALGLSGDNRLPTMHLRPKTLESVQAYIAETYADQLATIDIDDAIEAGFFGSIVTETARERLGDLVLVPRLGWTVQDPSVASYPLVSWHGGLSDWEMLVPFIWTTM
jgi:hypothetical protein